ARIDGQQVGAEPAAQTGEPAAQGKGRHEETRGVDADRLRHPQIVDGGAHPRAKAGPLDPQPQRRHQCRTAEDQKTAVSGETAKTPCARLTKPISPIVTDSPTEIR